MGRPIGRPSPYKGRPPGRPAYVFGRDFIPLHSVMCFSILIRSYVFMLPSEDSQRAYDVVAPDLIFKSNNLRSLSDTINKTLSLAIFLIQIFSYLGSLPEAGP